MYHYIINYQTKEFKTITVAFAWADECHTIVREGE